MRFLVIVLGLFAVASAINIPSSCPTVYDGNTEGRFDLQTQFSVDTFSANWIFDEDIIRYEWAIVSNNQFPDGASQLTCRRNQGFSGVPDTMVWTDAKKSESGTAKNLQLIPRTTYFAVLRTTTKDGTIIYSNSNGMIILPHLSMDLNEKMIRDVDSDNAVSTREILPTGENICYIDNANRCRQSKLSVQDILTEIYGPPVFVATDIFFQAIPPLESTTSGTTSDDDNGPWIAGIVIGSLLILAILLCLLALLGCLFVRGDGEEPFNTTVYSKEVEDVDADQGARVERTMGVENRVEFPDIDPHSRLSVAN